MIKEVLSKSELEEIPPGKIKRNPDNPRIFFRPKEMETLMASIGKYGIQVPITVYAEGGHYVLIDGERRWRCADKLNLKTIPALVQPKPSPLDNLLLMFNIHALREQWDYFTIANKLPSVIQEFKKLHGKEPNEIELSEATGLTRSQVRRCRVLLDLPKKYKDLLVDELSLPKQSQQLSEDFFIEMEKSLKTVQSRVPAAVQNLDRVRDALIKKFRSGVIGNITDFRKLSKIATSIEKIGVQEREAKMAIQQILSPNKVGIDTVYTEHFALRYDEKKVLISIDSITDYLETIATHKEQATAHLDPELKKRLKHLKEIIDQVLGV